MPILSFFAVCWVLGGADGAGQGGQRGPSGGQSMSRCANSEAEGRPRCKKSGPSDSEKTTPAGWGGEPKLIKL